MYFYNRWPFILVFTGICALNLLGTSLHTLIGGWRMSLIALILAGLSATIAYRELRVHRRVSAERSLLRDIIQTVTYLLGEKQRIILLREPRKAIVLSQFVIKESFGRNSTEYTLAYDESEVVGGTEYGTRQLYRFDNSLTILYEVEPLNPDLDLTGQSLIVHVRRLYSYARKHRVHVGYSELRDINQLLLEHVVRRNLPR